MMTKLLLEEKNNHIHTEESGHKLQLKPGVDMDRLIGIPHLFGHFYDTREGFLIDPIGIMTLQPDGRITGYSHPNEGSWHPYKLGTVPEDKAFAFITAHNNWIPSSTWQQTLGEMPIGYYCDEPEALKKLCLIPHRVKSNKTQIVYLVASCLRFFEHTVPKILHELYAEGIEPERIKVVVNGSAINKDEIINGVSHAFSTHNAWEWSALYEAPLRWKFDYGMLIHDTNHIFPGFRRKVESFNQHMQWDHLPATPVARCLLGLYSHKFLLKLNPWLKEIDGISKKDGIIAEASGELLLRSGISLVMGDPESNGRSRQAEWKETVDIYNTGSPRIRRVFPSINLHKFIHANATDPQSL
jgi:hypothetical protein